MVKADIIESSVSEYASSPVVVRSRMDQLDIA